MGPKVLRKIGMAMGKKVQCTFFSEGTSSVVDGGDSSKVQDHLVDVRSIYASWGAFAAVKTDGKVVAWGNPEAIDAARQKAAAKQD